MANQIKVSEQTACLIEAKQLLSQVCDKVAEYYSIVCKDFPPETEDVAFNKFIDVETATYEYLDNLLSESVNDNLNRKENEGQII